MKHLHRLVGLAALAAGLCLPGIAGARSAPAGRSAAATPQGALYTVAFRSAQRGWLGGAHTILATTNGGQTWTREYAGPTTIRQFSFVSDSAGWAMGPGALLRTTDGGQTWTTIHKPPNALQQIAFVTPSQGWAIAGKEPNQLLLYRTRDGGQTWARQSLSVPIGAVCFSDPAHGWAARSFSMGKTQVTLLATADGGTTWRPVAAPPGAGGLGGFEGQSLSCPAPGVIWDLVNFGGYAGGVAYALYRSVDGGTHWQAVAQNMAPGNADAPAGPGTAAGALAAPSAQVGYLAGTCFACGDRGTTSVGETLDGGKHWRNRVIPGLPSASTALSFPSVRDGWLVATWQTSSSQQSAVFQTPDGGLTWQRRVSAP